MTLTFNLLTLKNMSKDAIREDVGYHDVRMIKGETTAFIVQMIYFNILFLKTGGRSVDLTTSHKPTYTITDITPTMDEHAGNKPEATTSIGKNTFNLICS